MTSLIEAAAKEKDRRKLERLKKLAERGNTVAKSAIEEKENSVVKSESTKVTQKKTKKKSQKNIEKNEE